MIDVGEWYFMCDECGICSGVEWRLANAVEDGYEFQYDHCGCDKVDHYFYAGGYCEDAFQQKHPQKKHGKRKTGTAYRRAMAVKKRDDLMKIFTYGYNPYAGYVDWGWVDGVWQQTGKYIKYIRSSRSLVYWKNQSNRKVRRYKGSIPKGNSYRKHFEYVYTIF